MMTSVSSRSLHHTSPYRLGSKKSAIFATDAVLVGSQLEGRTPGCTGGEPSCSCLGPKPDVIEFSTAPGEHGHDELDTGDQAKFGTANSMGSV